MMFKKKYLIKDFNKKKFSKKIVMSVMTPLTMISSASRTSLAQEIEDHETLDFNFNDETFHFGDSCHRLNDLTKDQMMDLINFNNKIEWNHFCKLKDLEACDEYSYLFGDSGVLISNMKDPESCQFIPSIQDQDLIQNFYKKYGIK